MRGEGLFALNYDLMEVSLCVHITHAEILLMTITNM